MHNLQPKTQHMKKLFLLSSAVLILLSSCKKHDLQPEGTFKGPEVTVFNGKAYTVFRTDNWGQPRQLAIVITDDALNSVASTKDDEDIYMLEFHPRALITPFNHAELDWNPHGHPPAGIYTVPHFDCHFYMITEQEQAQIPPYEVDSSKFLKYPSKQYLPENYIPIPGGVPMMGKHWVDVTSPELNGQPFTQTFIYGTYNSKVTFYEPMITLDFLKNTDRFVRSIPQPAKYQKSGFYPTEMRIFKHDGVTEVILEDFVFRHQS